MATKEVNNHKYYKKRLEAAGFPNVTPTELENDALYFLICDLEPCFLVMDARFYQCCTPFRMGELRQKFPKMTMVAVSIGEYPVELGMSFIVNGINSYISTADGIEQCFKWLLEISKGRDIVSPAVQKRIDSREEKPEPAGKITSKLKQMILLICSGFQETDITDTMAITRKTVYNHKTEIYRSLKVRNCLELLRAALTLGIVKFEEIFFYPRNYTVNPRPAKKIDIEGLF